MGRYRVIVDFWADCEDPADEMDCLKQMMEEYMDSGASGAEVLYIEPIEDDDYDD